MNKYYIYRQFSNIDSHHYTKYTGDTLAYTNVKDPITNEIIKSYDFCINWSHWRYSLSKTKGEFYGAGNFCGYYGYSCWRGCELIADELFDLDSEGDVLSAIFVEYKEPITYDVNDTYSMPKEVEFESDDEAIKYFVELCEQKLKEE